MYVFLAQWLSGSWFWLIFRFTYETELNRRTTYINKNYLLEASFGALHISLNWAEYKKKEQMHAVNKAD